MYYDGIITKPSLDELYHHGILGMKWGKRNGPPYPLKAGAHSSSEKQAGYKKSIGGGRNESQYSNGPKASKKTNKALEKISSDTYKSDKKNDETINKMHQEHDRHHKNNREALQNMWNQDGTFSKQGKKFMKEADKISSKYDRKFKKFEKQRDKDKIKSQDQVFGRKDIKKQIGELYDTEKKISDLHRDILGTNSSYGKKSYEEYMKKNKDGDDYTWAHYLWGEGDKNYDKALKDFNKKSESLRNQRDSMRSNILSKASGGKSEYNNDYLDMALDSYMYRNAERKKKK